MKYFFSGASGIRASVLPQVAAEIDYRLLSMHDSFKSNTRYWCEVSHHKDCAMKECMLDSGAFTAWTKGKKVDLDSLIRVYEDTERKLKKGIAVWFINLDVIPGSREKHATPAEMQKALDDSDANFKILRKRFGARVLPVYHQTEGEKRLREVASQSDYIGMGFRREAEKYRVRAAEDALAVLKPLGKKVHGLATTGFSMMSRTNFDSVDSASWLYAAAMGKVMVINQDGRIAPLTISAQSPQQKDYRGHYNSLPHEEQKYSLARFKRAGVTLDQLQNDLSYRILFVAKEMSEWLRSRPVSAIQSDGGLFSL